MLSLSFRDGLKSPKVEDGLFGALESHKEKIFTVHILYQSVAENTMVYLFVH